MDRILGQDVRSFCINYIDDILIASPTWSQHLEHIDIVLRRLKEANMTVKLRKSHFAETKLTFLGHKMDFEGIMIDQKTLNNISQFPTPKNRKHLQAFIGLCNWERRFVPNFSDRIFLIQNLLKKDVKFRWGKEEQDVFLSVKQSLQESCKLYHPNPKEPFYVETDASGHGIGAKIYQYDSKNNSRTIAYHSRTLKGGELNYTTM